MSFDDAAEKVVDAWEAQVWGEDQAAQFMQMMTVKEELLANSEGKMIVLLNFLDEQDALRDKFDEIQETLGDFWYHVCEENASVAILMKEI